MQSKTIIDLLGNEKIRKFIGLHLNDDAKNLALQAKKHPDMDVKAISLLISIYQKAKIKLPEHYKILAAFNFKCYEQCTCEAVALYKASIMSIKNKRVINLTGGIGIDDWAMANYAQSIDSCEIDSEIHQLAVFNLRKQNINLINRHLINGLDYVRQSPKTDLIYIDPDRRPSAQKIFRLEQSEPNIIPVLEELLEKADEVWIKISPMADITYLKNNLKFISKMYVIAWLGEVKEILVACSLRSTEKIKLYAVNIKSDEIDQYESEEDDTKNEFSSIGNYLYEPNKAIIKAGLSFNYASKFGLKLLSKNSNFFISDQLVTPFMGRSFVIVKSMDYKPREIHKYLKDNGISQANITTRNFREKADDLKKRFKLMDGGKQTLCFCLDYNGNGKLFHCHYI